MKIIFFGDLAYPFKNIDMLKDFINKNELFKDKLIIGNLEGLLVSDEQKVDKEKLILYNHENIVNIFGSGTKTILTLANNHVRDIPENFEYTLNKLNENNIGYTGAKLKDSKSKDTFYEFDLDNIKYAVFGHCWNVMDRLADTKKDNIYVSNEEYIEFIDKIKDYKKVNKNVFIIIYLHWNFDFEQLPFPQHREIARKLIDIGADIVVGGHSHIVNGGEIYNNKPIIYGMGNFYIPNNVFMNKKLKYPKESNCNLLFEYDTITKASKCYWVRNNENIFEIFEEENFENGSIIEKYSLFRNMNEKEYLQYFKKNRKKRRLVPIYNKLETAKLDRIKNYYMILRIKIIRILKKILRKV